MFVNDSFPNKVSFIYFLGLFWCSKTEKTGLPLVYGNFFYNLYQAIFLRSFPVVGPNKANDIHSCLMVQFPLIEYLYFFLLRYKLCVRICFLPFCSSSPPKNNMLAYTQHSSIFQLISKWKAHNFGSLF